MRCKELVSYSHLFAKSIVYYKKADFRSLVGAIANDKLHLVVFLFLGIRRPTALLCSTAQTPDIEMYEISLIEPLHDFKNTINRILGELPYVTQNLPHLQSKINDALTVLEGEKKLIQNIEYVKAC